MPRWRRTVQKPWRNYRDAPTPAQAHSPAARPIEGVSLGLPASRLRVRGALNEAGHIDPELWHKYRDHCRVRRFWQGEDDQVGRLVHKPGGAEHARWVFDYDADRDDDDEAGYRFGSHAFMPGEYVSIRDEDGETHTFQVTSMQPAA